MSLPVVLPLPRPRPDPDLVRARLRALAQGAWGELPAPLPGAGLEGSDGFDGSDQGGRLVVTRAPLRVVLLAVGATALATWLVLRLASGGAPSAVELLPGGPAASVPPSASSFAPGGSAVPTPSPSAPEPDLVVQVLGQVRRPGLVRVAPGSRVADAIAAAGGIARGGGSGGLNLARPVVDGEQIVVSRDVPVGAAGTGSGPASGGTAVVDLNTATVADLDSLPGVGPVMAQRILDWRSQHGRFASVDQLREVSGIGERTFARLKPLVRV